MKFGHIGRSAANQIFCDSFIRIMTSYTGSNEIAYFGYVDSYDDPINRTMVLQITRTDLNMTGNIGASGKLNVSGTTILNNAATCISSLNVSGITTLSNTTNIIGTLNISGTTLLNNFITMNSPLYINTNQPTTISALSVNSTSASVLVNIVQNLVWNDGVNYALNVTGYSMFGGVQINGQDSNNIYKRVGDLTIASPSLNSIILKSNNGNWEAMRLNSAGISMNTSLYVSGLTTLNNATTINGILSVKNDVWHQSNDNIYRLYFAATGTTYICSGGAAADNGLVVFSSLASGGYTTNLAIKNNGDTSIRGSLTSSGALYANGDVLNFPNLLNQYKINLWGTNNYGFGIAGGTIMYSSANYHKFYNSNNNVNTFTIDSVGNTFCTGSFTSGNTIAIKGTSESDTATLYLATPFTPSSAYKCALIAQGMSTYSRSKLHICLNNTADNSTLYNAGLSDYCATFDYNGNVGIGNTNPLDDGGYTNYLCVGNSSITGSEGAIDIGKKNATGGSRHYKFGITYDFFWGIGDLGHSNTIGTWQAQVMCYYSAPFNSLLINSTGLVIMPYGYTTGSDERIKTNIQTIENALDKTLLLRGVEYNDIRIEPEKKKIGLIAQDVELIVPEVVHTDEKTTMKSIEYQSLIPLLIEAIKDQQKQINELKTILIKNNLY